MTTEKSLILPVSREKISQVTQVTQITKVRTKGNLLFIGANGSGKTRLGTWIEIYSPRYQQIKVHRISAHKSLSMPDDTQPQSIDKAEKDLLFGNGSIKDHSWGYKSKGANKWGNKPETHLLTDYNKLMVYLFSQQIESNATYCNAAKAIQTRIEPPLTKLDRVKQVWETVLPHRELIISGLKIQTKVKDTSDKIYQCSEMSDGERVIFYLIGQCLATPTNGTIIIDEPELHLHKSIQIPLWEEIEKLRPDCLFVYLTHDVDFAAAQANVEKIWLKSYDGNSWEWEKIKTVDGFPEELLIEILGSRKPIVFIEGESKFDVTLHRSILDKFLVIPRGGCTQVIQSVKALRNSPQLHHLDVYGIIDRDRRNKSQIQALLEDGIYVLEVAEIENLFCTPEILEFVSKQQRRNATEDLKQVKEYIFKRFNDEIETQISERVSSEIQSKLNSFEQQTKGKDSLEREFQRVVNSISILDIYNSTKERFQKIVNDENYDDLLRYYNRKSLATQICGVFGLKNDELREFIIRCAQNNNYDRDEIKSRLKKYFGAFAEHMD